jgi:hypothetical protein
LYAIVDNFDCFPCISETSSKGANYKLFKGELKFENYLDILEDKDKTLCRFRTTNHRLPVEVGRWKKNY